MLLGLVNARILQLECASVLHESLLVPVLTYGSETRIWRKKERYGTAWTASRVLLLNKSINLEFGLYRWTTLD